LNGRGSAAIKELNLKKAKRNNWIDENFKMFIYW